MVAKEGGGYVTLTTKLKKMSEIEILKKDYHYKELPLEEALELEVKQNIERDIRAECLEAVDADDKEVIEVYGEEAEILFRKNGHGYLPEHMDHFLVIVQR